MPCKDYILFEKPTSLLFLVIQLWCIGESSEREILKRFRAPSVTWDAPPKKGSAFQSAHMNETVTFPLDCIDQVVKGTAGSPSRKR
jgi:hypothetical protein